MRWSRLFAWSVFLGACGAPSTPAHHEDVEVEHPITETELPTLRISKQTTDRLRVQTALVEPSKLHDSRLVGGEVVVPPGRTILVTAAVAGEVHFAGSEPLIPGAVVKRGATILRLHALAPADRDTRARVAREVSAAEANLTALELRVTRNQSLVEQRAGSTRALEEAIAARDVAKADVETARARAATLSRDPLLSDVAMVVRAPSDGVLRVVSVAEGQTVAGGAALFEFVSVDSLQVRVPVYSGDLSKVDMRAQPEVRRNGSAESYSAQFVVGPPTSEPDRSTVDRYLALPAEAGFQPGERVLVDLPFTQSTDALSVPAASIVLDAWGGAWVYRADGDRYTRVRVDPIRRAGDRMVIAGGPKAGTKVVSIGAVELFGAEFPPGH